LIIALTLLAFTPAPALAQWQEHVSTDLGMAKEFPGAPLIEEGEYQTIVIGDAPVPAIFYSAELGGVELKMTVADMRAPDLAVKGASAMGECYFDAELEGDVLSNNAYRLEDGTPYGIHGRIVDVILDADEESDVLGFERARKQTSCFFAKGRLFKSEAVIADTQGAAGLEMASRFVRSLRFDVGQ
jgi:hypothetical protein